MIEEIKLRKQAVYKALKESRKKKYSCFFPGCSEKAISSHSQSKSSSLKNIQENGLVFGMRQDPFAKNPMPTWKQIGLTKVSTFSGFCSTHDNDLFKEVDSISDTNLSSKSLAYLAFRTFAMEMRKKEYCDEMIDLIQNNIKKMNCDEIDLQSNNPKDGFENCLKVTKPFYLTFFGNFLATTEEPQMAHKTFRLRQNLGVSCSTFINPVPVFRQPIDKPQPIFAFNILPRKNYTLIIFSCAENDLALMNNFINNNGRLEDLVFNFCEEITINPTFFNKIPPSVLQTIDQALLPWNMWGKKAIPDLFNVKLNNSFLWKLTDESPL